jgi:hypothetical protein
MIGCKTGYSLAKVYTVVDTSIEENFKHEWKKNDMVVNKISLFTKELSRVQVSWATLKPSDK